MRHFSKLSRRRFAALAVAAISTPSAAFASRHVARPRADGLLAFGEKGPPLVDFRALINNSVKIRAVEQRLTPAGVILIRVISEDGAEGVVRASTKAEEVAPFVRRFAAPRFEGEDARDVEQIIEKAYRQDYEFAGLVYWAAIGAVEAAIMDLLGKVAGKRCAEFAGPVLRERIPIYMSSNKRDTAPEVEVAHLVERVAETGARAVKVKIGRRMGRNTDFAPGRSEAVLKGLRDAFGPDMTIYCDANGAYDAPTAIEICAMLENYGVAMFEEPCPFEDIFMTKQVSDRVSLPIAGGEQDYAHERWRWMIDNRALDIVQPDIMYGGGYLRCIAVQRMAAAAGLGFSPHFPRNGCDAAPMIHHAAAAENLFGFQEYRSRPVPIDYEHTPMMEPVDGEIALPPGPGWGVEYSRSTWRRAKRI